MVQAFRVFAVQATGLQRFVATVFCVFAFSGSMIAAQSSTTKPVDEVVSKPSQPDTTQSATGQSATKATKDKASEGQTSEPAAVSYQLRYKFQPNQILKYETKQTIIQTGVAPFGEQVETNKVEQRRVYKITDVAEAGTATASMQFEYVRMERKAGEAEAVVFDTKMKEAEIPAFFRAAAKSLKTKAPVYELHPQGTDVNDESLEQNPAGGQASFVVPMPEAAKAVGDSWTTFVEVKVRMAEQIFRTIKLRKTFRLKAVKDGVAEIGMATSTVGSVKDPRVKVQLLQATPSGTIWFDIDRGLVTKKEIRFNNTVLNAMGPQTMVSAKGRTIDRLL